ncbi:uncharacterized protein LOC132305127 [Cornus florida]|uniref:uncharacterized protein LOC132305127 n=1 Tax=Cornus florida TaxID=4283 RepID=UPI00289EE0D9|nr:uncharacterized protein LOC132305127 [Cornus florida]
MECLSSAWFSILINGSPCGFFQPTKGLRQGCPLSLLLFTLVTESFFAQMDQLVREEKVAIPRMIFKAGMQLSHMFYADDLLVVLQADISTAKNLTAALGKFSTLSGLTVSPEKSTIFFSKLVRRRRRLMRIFHCQMGRFPITYLDLPLLPYGLRRVHCSLLIDKFTNKINVWNGKCLSMVGRLELVKLVLTSYVYFWCSIYTLPRAVVKYLEKKMRDFIWGSTTEHKKVHAFSWNKVKEAGFGVRKITDINSTSMCRLIGDGQSTFLFTDPWVQGESLVTKYGYRVHRDFNLAKQAKLSSIIQNGQWQFPHQNSNTLHQFKNLALSLTLKQGDERWRNPHPEVQWFSVCWSGARPRASLVCCLAMQNKLLTFENLKKRGLPLLSICHNCMNSADDVDHLTVNCPFAKAIWQWLSDVLGWNMPRVISLTQLVDWFVTKGIKHKAQKRICATTVWYVWNERNLRLHQEIRRTVMEIARAICGEVLMLSGMEMGELCSQSLAN